MSYPLIHIHDEEMAFFWGGGVNVKIEISQHLIFTFLFFGFKGSASQQIFNCLLWNWSQMFTYDPYYLPWQLLHFGQMVSLPMKCRLLFVDNCKIL